MELISIRMAASTTRACGRKMADPSIIDMVKTTPLHHPAPSPIDCRCDRAVSPAPSRESLSIAASAKDKELAATAARAAVSAARAARQNARIARAIPGITTFLLCLSRVMGSVVAGVAPQDFSRSQADAVESRLLSFKDLPLNRHQPERILTLELLARLHGHNFIRMRKEVHRVVWAFTVPGLPPP